VPGADPPLFTGFLRDLTEQRRTERRRATQYRVSEILAGTATLEAGAPALLAALSDGFDVGRTAAAVRGRPWRGRERERSIHGAH
jgi:hypothetical protein